MDPDLLATFARRDYVTDADSPEAEALAVEQWIAAGCPDVDGLTPEDREALRLRPFTVRQAALRERVDVRTVYRWLSSGELQAHRAGSQWRIPQDALERRRVESAKPKPKATPAKRRRKRAQGAADSSSWFTA